MLYDAKGKTVLVGGVPMHYVEFGRGTKPLVLLPGLVDGLRTVEGQALNLAFFYRKFAREYRVYMFSRPEKLQEGCTIKDMADDLAGAFGLLGIEKAFVMGVSQGGMIAQRLAIGHPYLVEKLILAVSISRPNDVMCGTVNNWIAMARKGDAKALIIDTMEKVYSPKRLRLYRIAYPLIWRVGKPKSFERFLIQAEACLTHDTYSELEKITCPTLVVGGDCDVVVGAQASPEMAEKIAGSRLHIYEVLGHAAYDEGKGFNGMVLDFLTE